MVAEFTSDSITSRVRGTQTAWPATLISNESTRLHGNRENVHRRLAAVCRSCPCAPTSMTEVLILADTVTPLIVADTEVSPDDLTAVPDWPHAQLVIAIMPRKTRPSFWTFISEPPLDLRLTRLRRGRLCISCPIRTGTYHCARPSAPPRAGLGLMPRRRQPGAIAPARGLSSSGTPARAGRSSLKEPAWG